ncbi:hypothetical protein EHS25_003940 [Saitozyma podzolica]|uniref:Phytase n=1 Tax=Saitozyma podzolica TaxID=1890683 RepID=A0A427YSS9_9TREE|nr:hypothetical protein EHS25_003940 [Saitozyma podzolica]
MYQTADSLKTTSLGPGLSEEHYELQLSLDRAVEPLLPQYDPKPSSPTTPLPPHEHRRSRACNALVCLWATVVALIIGTALFVCWFGSRRLDNLRGWQAWEQLRQEIQYWVDAAAPYHAQADHRAFPTDIGYAGPTPTGVEPALLATAPAAPMHSDVSPFVPPNVKTSSFSIMQHWATSHLSTPSRRTVCPKPPRSSRTTVSSRGSTGSSAMGRGIQQAGLAPFGRQQMCKWAHRNKFGLADKAVNLGVAARVKYGFLLDKMKDRLPVFRTETQDRMLKSAQNFAAGFFGIPAGDQFNLEVMIEAKGFNNSLAPWNTCPDPEGYNEEITEKLHRWDVIFLKDARTRLQKHISGYDLSTNDVKGFGLGWVQELVSRLTNSRLTEFNSTVNSSFHDDVQFPLYDPIYVDFTHDTEFALLLATMNLTSFAESGEPRLDHIPKHGSFVTSKFCPFGANLQVQVLKCSSSSLASDAKSKKQIRLILNDAAVPLTGINGCPTNDDGLCPFEAFVGSMQTIIGGVDFARERVRQ